MNLPKDTHNFSDVDSMGCPRQAVEEMDRVRALNGIQLLKERGLKLLHPNQGEKFLDIGCGTGDDVRRISPFLGHDGRIIGIDSSRTMIDEAVKRTSSGFSNVEFRLNDVHHLEFDDASIDGIWCERTLQHVSNAELVLSEAHRVLRPGGRMVALDTDWETTVLNHPDRGLTRTILNTFCDLITNGWIGRQLLPLCNAVSFVECEVFAETIFTTDLSLLFEGLDFQTYLNELSKNGVLSARELEQWSADLYACDEKGAFFFAVTVYGIFARKK